MAGFLAPLLVAWMPKLDLGPTEEDLLILRSPTPTFSFYYEPPEMKRVEMRPPTCVFTGVVTVLPGKKTMVYERMCVQVAPGDVNVFEGEHRAVVADSQGRFPAPFADTYLVMKGNTPYIVFPKEGKSVRQKLDKYGDQPNVYTFEELANDCLEPLPYWNEGKAAPSGRTTQTP